MNPDDGSGARCVSTAEIATVLDPAATIVFKPIGLAAQDLATAGRVWRLLAERESAESV